MSVDTAPSNRKKEAQKRNNSGTFNVEKPKKMKKAIKAPVSDDKEGKLSRKKLKNLPVPLEGDEADVPTTKKRSLESGNDGASPIKKKKVSPQNGPSMTLKSKKVSVSHPKHSIKGKVTGDSEKPDWNKLKKEKKALRDKRRAAQKDADSYEVSIEAKKLLESIRSRKCPSDEQIRQLKNLHVLLKGKLLSVVYAHDMSRVIETMLKLAHTHKQINIFQEMVQELLPEILEMSKRKYATHVVRTMIVHSSPSERIRIVNNFRNHVLKLLSHKFGSVVLEQLYLKCKPEEQYKLQKELYGGSHMLVTSETVSGLDVIFRILPNMKESTLANTKKNLIGLFEKNVVESHIVHSVLLDYLSFANPDDSSELLEQARNHIKALTLSKEGTHVAMMCVWMGTPKARKKIVKELKGNVKALASGEHTYLLLLAIFDAMDDTIFINKALLSELLSGDLSPLLTSTSGRKVLMYLCSRRDPKMFSAPVVATLAAGDTNPHSKKDGNLRATELQKFTVPLLLEHISVNTAQWLDNNSNLLILLAAVKSGCGEQLESALKAIAKYVANPPNSKVGIDCRIADNTGCHMILKKIAQHDKTFLENGLATFGAALFSELSDQHYLAWLKNNHCCFLLLDILKNGKDEVVKEIKSKIKSLSPKVWKKDELIPIGGKRIQEILG